MHVACYEERAASERHVPCFYWKVLLLSAAWLTLMRTIPLWQRLIFPNWTLCSSAFGSGGAWPHKAWAAGGITTCTTRAKARRPSHPHRFTRGALIPYPLHSRIPYLLQGESSGKCDNRRGGGKTIFRWGRGGMRRRDKGFLVWGCDSIYLAQHGFGYEAASVCVLTLARYWGTKLMFY